MKKTLLELYFLQHYTIKEQEREIENLKNQLEGMKNTHRRNFNYIKALEEQLSELRKSQS